MIPLTITRNKKTKLDGNANLLLYGYGSYGYSMPANFSANVYSLVDRGMVYAIAHIRGGTENGFNWYLNGKLRQKKNTFFDFIATAEFLIEKGAYIDAGAGIGGTPIARAAYEGHKDIVELLIAKGADVNAKDGTGRSPLDSADDSVAEILRKNGAR